MAEGSEPNRPGWYPHRYGNEGMQSYWDGEQWTGESRIKPSFLKGPGGAWSFRNAGALGWVLLATVLGLVGSVVSGRASTALGWSLAAVTTLVWAIAAITARHTASKIVLWFWLVLQVFGWWLIFGLGSSPVGEDITAGVISDIGVEIKSLGVSEESWACVETGLVEGGYTQDLTHLPIRSVLLLDEGPTAGSVPPAMEEFGEGLVLFLFDPQQGCLTPTEILAVQASLSRESSEPIVDELSEETIAEFVQALGSAQGSGEIGFQVEHLHPTTFEIWTEEECVSAIDSWTTPQIPADVVSITFIGPFSLDYGNDRFGFSANTYRVEYNDKNGGRGRMHVSLDEGGPYWFGNCDSIP